MVAGHSPNPFADYRDRHTPNSRRAHGRLCLAPWSSAGRFFLMLRRPPRSTLFPYTPPFRSHPEPGDEADRARILRSLATSAGSAPGSLSPPFGLERCREGCRGAEIDDTINRWPRWSRDTPPTPLPTIATVILQTLGVPTAGYVSRRGALRVVFF